MRTDDAVQGEILSNHEAEKVLGDAAAEVVFVRCAFFMENWAMSVETIQKAGIFFTTLTPLDNELPMVSMRIASQTNNSTNNMLLRRSPSRISGSPVRLSSSQQAPR